MWDWKKRAVSVWLDHLGQDINGVATVRRLRELPDGVRGIDDDRVVTPHGLTIVDEGTIAVDLIDHTAGYLSLERLSGELAWILNHGHLVVVGAHAKRRAQSRFKRDRSKRGIELDERHFRVRNWIVDGDFHRTTLAGAVAASCSIDGVGESGPCDIVTFSSKTGRG